MQRSSIFHHLGAKGKAIWHQEQVAVNDHLSKGISSCTDKSSILLLCSDEGVMKLQTDIKLRISE